MEHLDLAGVISTPTIWSMSAFDQQDAIYLSNSRQMLEPILEETSEDEEHAQNSWNQYENSTSFWSSAESETGSVIRIEVNKDPDSISERDFACPAKRARRSDEFLIGGVLMQPQQHQLPQQTQPHPLTPSSSFDDTVLLRRYQRNVDFTDTNSSNSLERFLAYEACSRDSWGATATAVTIQPQRNSTGSRRFDDFSDSDSLSFNSLSRSSSLIQFESLERQLTLQEQHASMSSLGNSSPSVLSLEGIGSNNQTTSDDSGSGARSGANSGSNSGNNSRRGSQSSLLKRFESSDGRLHQTYLDLDKLNFDDDEQQQRRIVALFGGTSKSNMIEATVGEVKSDSESSTASGSSSSCTSGNSILTASKPSAEDLTDSSCSAALSTRSAAAARFAAFQRAGKSSAENLSEDSGYCEPSTLRRAKSKSIPKNFEKFCEEDEEFQQYEYEVETHVDDGDDDDDDCDVAMLSCAQNKHSKNSTNTQCNDDDEELDICQPKINDATFLVESNEARSTFNISTAKLPPPPLSPPPSPPLVESPLLLSSPSASQYYDCVKNSPTPRESMMLEHRRSLAHSPSPVSSDASGSSNSTTRSSTSASTCASAASFTWLPIQLQQKQQQQQQQLLQQPLQQSHRTHQHHQQQPKETLDEFCSSLRNSLPDIRDELSSESFYFSNSYSIDFDTEEGQGNGYGLEQSKAGITSSAQPTTPALATKQAQARSADDSDSQRSTSSSSSASAHDSHSDETDTETTTTPETARKYSVGSVGVESGSGGSTSAAASAIAGDVCGGCGGSGSVEAAVGGSTSSSSDDGEGKGKCYVNRTCISSVPSELNKLGRKKRQTSKHKYSKSSADDDGRTESAASNSSGSENEERNDFFDDSALKIRRSCSWSERRERNLQKFEHAFGRILTESNDKRLHTQSLGYMNASYQNLTLLDYSEAGDEHESSQTNYKRTSDTMATRKSNSADYEDLICKGNFLLDELSEIYDKNASILNDKPVGGEEEAQIKQAPSEQVVLASLKVDDLSELSGGSGSSSNNSNSNNSNSPRPPPRQRKHSNSSYSDLDGNDGGGSGGGDVQHVQLIIRKPPARQHHGRKSDVTNSLVNETTTTVIELGKTFDQDPTNLRTSYAQSLEKCNFDPNEISNSDLNKVHSLPKRRFQSPAAATKKRALVSSTPNLNAFNPRENELEDDIYVSSAHTSMHQLPQGGSTTGQKPLGILLPTGSRTSFSKEVSFCPVVSKYCWQEQSSEECNEPQQKQQDGNAEEETDDELLDNADATVLHNTKENEMIAARYKAENRQVLAALKSATAQAREQQQQQQVQVEKVRALLIVREPAAAKEEMLENINTSAETIAAVERKTSHKNEAQNEKLKKLVSNEIIRNVCIVSLPSSPQSTAVNASEVSLQTTIVDAAVTAEATTLSYINRKLSEQKQLISNKTAPCAILDEETTFESNGAGASDGQRQQQQQTQKRPLSIQLPILSEPPTNRAHHILYASQQMLDSLQRREELERAQREGYDRDYEHNSSNTPTNQSESVNIKKDTKSKSVSNLSSQKMSQSGAEAIGVSGGGGVAEKNTSSSSSGSGRNKNNNNEIMKTKFKDEKHPSSKGFLSRFANGFRFSLRRNKKKQLQQQQKELQQTQLQYLAAAEQQQQQQQRNGSSTDKSAHDASKQQQQSTKVQKSGKRNSSPDYIYIPLKGPLPAGSRAVNSNTNNISTNGNFNASYDSSAASTASMQSTAASSGGSLKIGAKTPAGISSTTNATMTTKVTGKPPLPKLPPRSVSLPSHQQQQQQGAGPHAQHYPTTTAANFNPNKQQFYTTDDFLDAERSYYAEFKNQLNSGLEANGRNSHDAAAYSSSSFTDYVESSSLSPRLSVSPETIMLLTTGSGDGQQQHHVVAGTNGGARHLNATIANAYVKQNNYNNSKIGLIETDLDTHETVISGKTRSLMDIVVPSSQQHRLTALNAGGGAGGGGSGSGGGSCIDDGDADDDDTDRDGSGRCVVKSSMQAGGGQIQSVRRPHKSMEFLLDKENQQKVLPPENELQKSHEHNPAALSEHQLRIQASLQRLNIPDWFRQYSQSTGASRSPDGANSKYVPGSFTRKRTTESGRWAGLNSKTTSLSSLGSQRSDRSPLLLSPSAHSHHGGQTTGVPGSGVGGAAGVHHQHHHHAGAGAAGTGAYGTGGPGSFSRWSTSHLNSSQTSPSVSQRGSFTRGGPVNSSFISVASGNSGVIRNSFRQPYLGWRSTEKLSQRTPHERLATSLLAQQQRTSPTQRTAPSKLQPVTPEIQSSIKEVTSAIVHYVNDQTNQQRSRSTSPNSRKCWLESSFVGIRPLDSPQTPIIDNTTTSSFNAPSGAVVSNSSGNGNYNYNYNNNINTSAYSGTSSSLQSTATPPYIAAGSNTISTVPINTNVIRMNGLSIVGGGGGESTILI